jgi:hypothetical protein
MPLSFRNQWLRLRWPAAAVESAPKPVRDAFEAHEVAAQKAEYAQGKAHEASQSLARAAQDDRIATIEATASGKPLPPSVRPERRQAVEDAPQQANGPHRLERPESLTPGSES